MTFNSLSFVLLFPIVCAVYYLLPYRWRRVYLLLVSIAFYMAWSPVFALFLLWVAAASYGFALGARRLRHAPLWLAVVVTLLPLAFFKYYNFLNRIISDLLDLGGCHFSLPGLNWAVPIGISFYTFQALGYLIDVYKGKIEAERNVITHALFICFFPQVLSGPISRASDLMPQLKSPARIFNYPLAVSGAKMLVWGMFMKVVVADRLGLFVDTVFANVDNFNGMTLLFTVFCYSLQIYTDFAGYSLLAIGSAAVMGFRIKDNFCRPYFSMGFRDFWRRWHISLSTWLRDYVYIPLGGSRVPKPRIYFNLMATFMVSGLWHGANYTFVVWGLLHGLMICLDRATRLRDHLHKAWQKGVAMLTTFVLVSLLWLLFRVQTIGEAFNIMARIFTDHRLALQIPDNRDMKATVLTMSLMVALLFAKEVRDEWFSHCSSGRVTKWCGYVAVVLLILLFGVFDASQFIYISF
jgi:alginate O-acetyltransferase complex protein AlgI